MQRLTGARIERLDRRAKYLLAPLDRGETLVMHLGMSGRFEIAGRRRRCGPATSLCAQPPDPKHAHIVLRDRGRRPRSPSTTRAASATWT